MYRLRTKAEQNKIKFEWIWHDNYRRKAERRPKEEQKMKMKDWMNWRETEDGQQKKIWCGTDKKWRTKELNISREDLELNNCKWKRKEVDRCKKETVKKKRNKKEKKKQQMELNGREEKEWINKM